MAIPFEEVETAYEAMKVSFTVEGEDTIRRHLLMEGLGQGAFLHHALATESIKAQVAANAVAERLKAGSTFEEELQLWAQEHGVTPEPDVTVQPSPSALGAAVSAAVAAMEPGDWAGPLKTRMGWELIHLIERHDGPRNRAQVSVYRMQFLVGSPADRQQALADWSKLPLSGNLELIDCLSLDFRANRVAGSDSK
ncbi:MAG: peptidyl-prolyl cis-trans isomerase [Planctomycetes bacterium]|nr:peptidyl-prolyl cis-trans isomerase [Planctomycetota bacterium]